MTQLSPPIPPALQDEDDDSRTRALFAARRHLAEMRRDNLARYIALQAEWA
jgi:hypothetical protein